MNFSEADRRRLRRFRPLAAPHMSVPHLDGLPQHHLSYVISHPRGAMAEPETDLNKKKFSITVQDALRHYHDDEMLAGLRSLTNLCLLSSRNGRAAPSATASALRALLDASLDRLAQMDSQGADLLRRHFIQRETIATISRDLGYAERSIFLKLRRATTALAGLLLAAEEEVNVQFARDERTRRALASLPSPTFSRLFGVDSLLSQLLTCLTDRNRFWLIALEGMGGSGKTALARAAVETVVRSGHCARVAWITAQQHAFDWGHLHTLAQPALTYSAFLDELARALGLDARLDLGAPAQEQRLRQALDEAPTLVVVDNLETAADIQALTEGLHRLAQPTKVLLTTRHRVSAYDQVTSLLLRALPFADALAFLRYHAEERQAPALLNAPESDLARVVAVTDGNPLAIKLVVGQLLALPLPQVLDDLVRARAEAQDLYTFLFRYSWDRLSEPAQYLLLHMPLLDSRGATWDDLAAVSGVALNGHFRGALQELVNTSLLNAGAVSGDIVYSIHRLTEHFVLSDLVETNWRGSPWEVGNDVY